MNASTTNPDKWALIPRAVVAFSGLFMFHRLSGDALTSWSLMGLATLALLARVTGSLESRSTRIELSIASTICVLVFLQGGFIDHFNRLSVPLILSGGLLLVGLNALNLSIPQARIAVVPILLILFFASQRYFYPDLTSEFSNPILAIALLVAAWELLSALIHSKRDAPSIIETGTTLALLLIYYNQTAHFPIVASLATIVIMAYFYGALRTLDASDHAADDADVTVQLQRDPLHNRRNLKPYLVLFFAGFSIFLLTAWGIFQRASSSPFLASLEIAPKILEIEQRNRVEQAFFSFKTPESDVPKTLKPLNISILENALKKTRNSSPSSNRRKVVIRTERESDKFNIGDQDQEKVQTTRILKIPPLRISPVQSSQSLPEYSLTPEMVAGTSQTPGNTIQYDFGFDSDSIESAAATKPSETLTTRSAGGPIRFSPSPASSGPLPSTASQPSQAQTRSQIARTNASSSIGKRDGQASVGFSPHLEFAANVSVELETRPVMEVYLPGSAKWISSLYLRFNTLEEIETDRFVQAQDHSSDSVIIDQPDWNDAPKSFRSNLRSDDPWTIAIGSSLNNWVPLLGPFESIKLPAGQSFSANGASFSINRVSGSGPFAYQVRGLQISDTWLANRYSLSESERERLTKLPLSSREISYLKRLGSRIGGKNPSAATFARQTGYYFERAHPYAFDFDFKSADENLLVSWLKARSPGICGYYAGAFTLLARAQGIPARVVVGALTREFDSKSRKFIVRERDAHAWAEYLNEENEWVRADLTPIALDSPRFTAKDSESEFYANNIESAIATLEKTGTESSEPAQKPVSNQETASALADSETSIDSVVQQKIIPSTATLIDQVLEREEAAASEILELTSELVAESNPPPLEATSQPIELITQPNRESETELAEKSKNIDEFTELIAPGIAVASAPAIEKQPWHLSFPVVINYLFIVLLAAFAYSQFRRNKKYITESGTVPESSIQRERTLAGRLLSEIDTLRMKRPEASQALQNLRQRALKLRYSPHCTLSEIKSLKRDFRQSTANLKPIR